MFIVNGKAVNEKLKNQIEFFEFFVEERCCLLLCKKYYDKEGERKVFF